jgi:hypothetical protein
MAYAYTKDTADLTTEGAPTTGTTGHLIRTTLKARRTKANWWSWPT